MHKTTCIATIGPKVHKTSRVQAGSSGDAHHNDEGAIAMAAIELHNVIKRFATADGGSFTALKDISLTVEDGQFCAVVGPTGCGKSTTLTLISCLESPSACEVFFAGKPFAGIDTGTGFVFQQDAVFPWKSVLDNVSAGPLFCGVDKAGARTQARDWIRRVGLAASRAATLISFPGGCESVSPWHRH
jgi:ABC-type nitrate/sulfonate/bicarbonate transport system ATPase subunit